MKLCWRAGFILLVTVLLLGLWGCKPAEDTGYTVLVVDTEGAPLAGVTVQVCKDICAVATTDDAGRAQFSLQPDTYKATILSMPAGYTYATGEQEFSFTQENTVTIVLTQV